MISGGEPNLRRLLFHHAVVGAVGAAAAANAKWTLT